MTPSPFQRNSLQHASSPYLRQHADNPVHWQEWTPEVLEHAKATEKPILLSIGYAACHWCHVMAHESFEDEETAALMNKLFVNIKVDREERPDVDQLYMAALHATGVQGGWPLTMFLTPDALPYWGGTYFPPKARHGMPAFQQVLQHLSDAFHQQKETITQNSNALKKHLEQLNSVPSIDDEPQLELLDKFVKRTMQMYDPVNGGLKGSQKFPNAPMLETWARASSGNPESLTGKAFLHSVRKLCHGGIYDHLRGGIARYTVDENWLIPHFEKMLYDNAHFIRHLVFAYKLTGESLFRKRIEETIGWLEEEMKSPSGAFYSSLDADSEGEEGKFYTWTEDEIKTLLKDDYQYFSIAYDVSSRGNWEGVNILNRLHENKYDYAAESIFAPMREKLLSARNARIRPGLDDKVLTDWNGYVIRALAEAGQLLQRNDWVEQAQSAFHFISESSSGEYGLNHSWREGVAVHPANATDYAAMINAALSLYELTGEATYLEKAGDWLETLKADYTDDQGGFYLTSNKISDLITRPRCDQDEANPAGAAQILEALIRYAHLSADESAMHDAQALANNLYAVSKQSSYGMAGFMNGLDSLFNHAHVSIDGMEKENGDALMTTAFNFPLMALTVSRNSKALLFQTADPHTGGPDAFAIVCKNHTCSKPVMQLDDLQDLLKPEERL